MEDVAVQPSIPQSSFKEKSKFLSPRNILLLFLILLIIGAAVSFVLISNQRNPAVNTQATKEPTVSLTKGYDNPFDKSTQYVNPFSEYKNPFDQLIK